MSYVGSTNPFLNGDQKWRAKETGPWPVKTTFQKENADGTWSNFTIEETPPVIIQQYRERRFPNSIS